MQLIDPNHPAYRPLWARILIVAVCFGWALVEIVTGDPFWSILSGAAGVYATYMLFWAYKPQPPVEAVAEAEAPNAPVSEDAEEKKAID
jgi:hypothetical protein